MLIAAKEQTAEWNIGVIQVCMNQMGVIKGQHSRLALDNTFCIVSQTSFEFY